MPLNNSSPSYGSAQPHGYSNMDSSYSNQPFNSAWLEKEQSRNKRSKWLVSCPLSFRSIRLRSARSLCAVATHRRTKLLGGLAAVIVIVGVGVGVGVGVANSHKSSSKTSSGSSVGAVNQTNPNDPSSFLPDSRLKKSFWGIAYTPEGSQYPACGNKLGMSDPSPSRRRYMCWYTTLTARQRTSLRTFRYPCSLAVRSPYAMLIPLIRSRVCPQLLSQLTGVRSHLCLCPLRGSNHAVT